MTRMEEKEVGPFFLLYLPTEIIEKILLYLALFDRKNIRLTCKWLYELCNSDRFWRDENIRWSENLIKHLNVQSDLFRIGRSYYNLMIESIELEKPTILPFFEKVGAKIRSVVLRKCYFLPGLLETIIIQCEGLCSLYVEYMNIYLKYPVSSAELFTLEPFSITRPNVTYLNLSLSTYKPYDYFHPIFSIFPNVKHLEIKWYQRLFDEIAVEKVTPEFSFIFDDIMKAGSSLEHLKVNFPITHSNIEKDFFGALPNLKHLNVNCFYVEFYHALKWYTYPCCSNLVSVEIGWFEDFGPPEMIRLLTNTRLKNLSIRSANFTFNEESFKKLVASQLDTILMRNFSAEALDCQLEANKSVQNLTVDNCTEILFPKYFCGLVHLDLECITDTILQCIFQYQENLRSLSLWKFTNCSINGFCGSKNNGFEYSINNLQKLEHLKLEGVPPEIFQSHDFKQAFSLPRLKYLYIICHYRSNDPDFDAKRIAKISTDLYENLTELRALRLGDDGMPSRETLSSLFSSLKHLNYLRYDMDLYRTGDKDSATFTNVDCKYYAIDPKKYKDACSLANAYYDENLNRMIITNHASDQHLYRPKFSTHEINWIRL